jgi:hypothetical protein
MKILATTFSTLLLFTALPAHAQTPDVVGTPRTPAKPVDPPANRPASDAPEKKKTKKVWTNDEIGSVKGAVSVVGDGDPSSEKSGDSRPASSSGAEEAHQKQIEDYRNQIQQYQSQMDSIDKRIEQLKNFKAENTTPSGGIHPNQGYNMVPIEDQVKQLEDKKKQLQAKIDDTEVAARKNGIDSGDLR